MLLNTNNRVESHQDSPCMPWKISYHSYDETMQAQQFIVTQRISVIRILANPSGVRDHAWSLGEQL